MNRTDNNKKLYFNIVASIVTYESNVDDVVVAVKTFLDEEIDSYIQIIDNNSSADYVKKLSLALTEAKLDTEIINCGSNKGFGYGHNYGIAQAPDCEYYLVLNPDVVIKGNTTAELVNYMDENKNIGLISPKILNVDGSIQYLNKRNPTVFDMFIRRFLIKPFTSLRVIKKRLDYYVMKDKGYETVQEVEYMSGCFMLFRTDILKKLGGFDDNIFMYLEDADITRRVNEVSQAIYYPYVSITHKWSRGSHTSFYLTLITIKSAIYYFNKWGYKLY